MSDVQDAANEFFEAIVKHVVDDCIDIARDTRIDYGDDPMRFQIIRRMEQYRNDPYSRIKKAAA